MNGRYVIIVDGFVDGTHCPFAGQYLQSFDVDAHDGLGDGKFTRDRDKAMQFPSRATALDYWRWQSTKVPLRDDGQPNRPMKVFNITVEGRGWLWERLTRIIAEANRRMRPNG